MPCQMHIKTLNPIRHSIIKSIESAERIDVLDERDYWLCIATEWPINVQLLSYRQHIALRSCMPTRTNT